ncbi:MULTISPECIES: FG-GAP-like repeat-containing protein [unclassified Streptomyces]|uniref:FG-GAP-like repeat-containing protein n=1 Tax=unclassified Streptomyces TaxID=2593676 RepID=UPI002254FF80|nr:MULTISPECIES: FG-GAP-like repeat-containing protein [unclassified Streptomyces]MCX4883022.1 FG-GAP-like repeat-containing protein [Streptomyces sp. NBC_00847]MCX5423060.1 FG-GAP-like repeat-containing protein [Streptomyces sp. NBC_00078]
MLSLTLSGRLAVPVVAGLVALGLAPLQDLSRAEAATPAPVRVDFNGDGYGDLAVGAPAATVDGQPKAGYVAVLYGGPHGLSATRRVVISRATNGIPGSSASGEGFGTQLSRGDLDGDGYADLVIGNRSGTADAVVVWGGRGGFSSGTPIPATNTQTGDFNGDGKLDLALFRTRPAAGDDPNGSTATVWNGPLARSGTHAGEASLDAGHLKYYDVRDGATGDVNGDGRDDLALSIYEGDGVYGTRFYTGSPSGLTSAAPDAIPDTDGGIAFGDLDGDGYDDIAVGAVQDSAVTVARGSASGVAARGTWKTYTEDTAGVPGTRDTVDRFGESLSAADITGDGIDDLAVGLPGRELGNDDDAGAVDILRGSRAGLTGKGAQSFTQDTAGVPGTAEAHDAFGSAVELLDINGNGYADLAAAAVGEDGNGAVWELRGRPTGIVTDAALVFGPKAVGAPYAGAAFGSELG